MRRKNGTSTGALIILFLFVFIIGNGSLIIFCLITGGDAEANRKLIREGAIGTGSIVGINSVALILIECFERLEKTFFHRKNEVECFGEGTFWVLRCSSRYYMLPIVSVMLDIMLGFLFRQGSRARQTHE